MKMQAAFSKVDAEAATGESGLGKDSAVVDDAAAPPPPAREVTDSERLVVNSFSDFPGQFIAELLAGAFPLSADGWRHGVAMLLPSCVCPCLRL